MRVDLSLVNHSNQLCFAEWVVYYWMQLTCSLPQNQENQYQMRFEQGRLVHTEALSFKPWFLNLLWHRNLLPLHLNAQYFCQLFSCSIYQCNISSLLIAPTLLYFPLGICQKAFDTQLIDCWILGIIVLWYHHFCLRKTQLSFPSHLSLCSLQLSSHSLVVYNRIRPFALNQNQQMF